MVDLKRTAFVTSAILIYYAAGTIMTLRSPFLGQRIDMTEEKIVDWDKTRQAYMEFLTCPTEEGRMIRLLNLIPEKAGKSEHGDKNSFLEAIFGQEDWEVGNLSTLGILWNEVWLGKRPAVEVAFRLLNFVEGENRELLERMLSHLIRLRPEIFLDYCHKYRTSSFIKERGFPCDQFIGGYEMMQETQLYEIEERIKAIEGVKIADYEMIQNACIDKLKQKSSRIKSIGEPGVKSSTKQSIPFPIEGEALEGKVAVAFTDFLKRPDKNAAPFYEEMEISEKESGEAVMKAISGIVEGAFFPVLQYESLIGNRWAARAMFRMIKHSDGMIATVLLGSLADLIRFNPELFLEAYQEAGAYLEETMRDSLITYIGIGYYENLPLSEKEQEMMAKCLIKARIDALRVIHDVRLLDARDYCIKKLDNYLNNYSK